MSEILAEVLKANREYAAGFGDKRKLALPPARRFAILTCMDARLDPAKYAGLSEGDAHVIRNAGGRATDADAALKRLAQAGTVALVDAEKLDAAGRKRPFKGWVLAKGGTVQ